MKRSGFLKTLAAIATGLGLAPMVVNAEPEHDTIPEHLRKYPIREADAFPQNILKVDRVEHLHDGRHRLHYNPFENPMSVQVGFSVMDTTTGLVYLVTVRNALFLSTGKAYAEITPFQMPKSRSARKTCGNEFMIFRNATPERNGERGRLEWADQTKQSVIWITE